MPLALLAALAGSLAFHAAALFLPDLDLSTAPEPAPITAEIQTPRPPAAPKPAEPLHPKAHVEPHRAKPAVVGAAQAEAVAQMPAPEAEPGPLQEAKHATRPEPPPAAPAQPQLPHQGFIRFVVYAGKQGFVAGKAEHRWEFTDDRYRLVATTETVGAVRLFKSVLQERESRGRLTAYGLQPEQFTTRLNGSETNENAVFDWGAHHLSVARDGSRYDLHDGAQDVVSFLYQLAFLGNLADGIDMEVATGRKFERYRLDSLGEETLDTPAGQFRTLHLRAQTDSTTEVWLALDRRLLPVKIRHTDKKGDSFEFAATEIGM